MFKQSPQSPVTPNMYPLIPPTTGLEGGPQLTVKDEGGPELESVITTGPGAEGMTVQKKEQYLQIIRAHSKITLIELNIQTEWTWTR